MESIEKLRWRVKTGTLSADCEKELYAIADEIEAEIAERYMLLPVDAEGVPIHVGDTVTIPSQGKPMDVVAISSDKLWFKYASCAYDWDSALCAHHVKPRIVEDVLRDMLYEAADACVDGNAKIEDCIAKYAAELRMVGE